MTAYDEFLQASPYLDVFRNEYDRIFMTSLKSILAEYRAVKIYGNLHHLFLHLQLIADVYWYFNSILLIFYFIYSYILKYPSLSFLCLHMTKNISFQNNNFKILKLL